MLARRDAWARRCREKYDSGSHGRDKCCLECCPRIFDAPDGMVSRICDRLSFSFSLFLADFSDSFSPLVRGILSLPQDRWPNIFSNHLWADFPYFLPCLLAATFTCISFIIGVFYLEELCCFLLFEESYVVTTASRRLIRGRRGSSAFQLLSIHWHQFKLAIRCMLVCASHECVILDESISYGTVG